VDDQDAGRDRAGEDDDRAGTALAGDVRDQEAAERGREREGQQVATARAAEDADPGGVLGEDRQPDGAEREPRVGPSTQPASMTAKVCRVIGTPALPTGIAPM
jgi:hypothetical protein